MGVNASIGARIGRLKVLTHERKEGCVHKYANCLCDCGKKKLIRLSSLIGGCTQSCGCLAAELRSDRSKTHGHSSHELYETHYRIIHRCCNQNNKDYHHYGGRGIKVCDRWLDAVAGFDNFLQDMGPRPDKHEVDRIDVNGDYTPDNCRWATRKEQTRNTRVNHIINFNGQTRCLAEWADILGVSQSLLIDRLGKLGWSVERALTTPKITKRTGIRHGMFRERQNESTQ